MPILYIGLDDTDNLQSRGTGYLARVIADSLQQRFPSLGVVRHQLFVHPDVPYTSHNSSACLMHEMPKSCCLSLLFEEVKAIMLNNFQPGSDPGLAMAVEVPQSICKFGQDAKTKIVTQEQARTLAQNFGIQLEGLGGTEGGVIGAMAALGLCSAGNDGRYLNLGQIRLLQGLQPVQAVLNAGINEVKTLAEEPVETGLVIAEKMRPARRNGKAVLYVEKSLEGHYQPLKLD
ncbi:MAG: hypothetical protein VB108_05575 [Anaerolineaceae bacterium]|nr:hypothetical protein [Anaerolineaceae bacterium]